MNEPDRFHRLRSLLEWAGAAAALSAAAMALLPAVLILLATLLLESLRDVTDIVQWILSMLLPAGLGQDGALGNDFIRLHPWIVVLRSVSGAALMLAGLYTGLQRGKPTPLAWISIPLYIAGAWLAGGLLAAPLAGIAILAEAGLLFLTPRHP